MRAGGEHLPSLFKREKAQKFHITLGFSHHWPETKSDDPLSGVPPLDSGRWSFGRMYGCLSENAMAPHSSTLAWKIPWMEEPGRMQSMGSLRVGHDWATSLSLSCTGEGNGNPLQCSCLENPRDGGAWWAAVSGVTQSRTRLK